MLRCLGLELFEPIGEVGALAPHLLEAVCDVREKPVDRLPAVPAEERATELHVSDLDWGERHMTSLEECPDHGWRRPRPQRAGR